MVRHLYVVVEGIGCIGRSWVRVRVGVTFFFFFWDILRISC